MIKINAIRESDGDRLHREFFSPEFIAYRLGRPGHWQGSAVGKLGLTGPVEPGVFQKLLEGRSPEGEALLGAAVAQPNRILGWRISVAADAPTSVLWALAPPVVRGRIVTAHANAIRLGLGEVERHLNGRPWIENPDAPGRISTLTAKFHSGASLQQTPRLETNVFLFNLVFQTGKENTSFTREQAAGQGRLIHSVYQRALRSEITRAIGA
ncbi:MAG: relaxase domain-containing protein, partial [Legionella sp.]|nr:relaxase domain-containing protein [Legionella sp.]